MRKSRFLFLFSIVAFFFSCEKSKEGELFYTGFYKYATLIKKNQLVEDTTSYIISYYDFDCSMCIGEMMRVNDLLLNYSNVYFIISSQDSISAHFYLNEINPNGIVLWDKEKEFIKNNYIKFNPKKGYCIFVVKNNRLIYARNPLSNKFETVRFRYFIRHFKI